MPPSSRFHPGAATDKGTIAMAFVQEALAGVRAQGIDGDALLAQAGISPELLQAPQARVSSTHYGTLWHAIAQTMDDEFFGMDSHRMKAGSFTLLCHSVIHCDTLERALRRALRFFRLVLDDFEGVLLREGEMARVVLAERLPGPRRAFAYGTFLIILHGLACWLISRRIPLHHATFRCAEPDYSAEWRVLFSPDLRFDQMETEIAFPAEYLDMANVQNERTMKVFLRSAPANFLVKYRNSDGLVARIRRQLRDIPPDTWPAFETLAQQLHFSPSTLRRHLTDEGQSYQTIKDALRLDLAISQLSHSDKSVLDIALDLGFAEASAFHRAFKKWTGARPGEYRRALGGQ
ncbi:AraC family transcriptional regulator [Zoogloea sp.]|uniref:AraC family transcriptional regulator n=1 Tax=Zoogloea sp. TaxID=49181 RepID=UPI00262C4B9F|nr:AraC family transcriptional regulator [Zoogloea sp.]MDD3352267.1 AraC family transcriptional regulator [Zoogloea sp.]